MLHIENALQEKFRRGWHPGYTSWGPRNQSLAASGLNENLWNDLQESKDFGFEFVHENEQLAVDSKNLSKRGKSLVELQVIITSEALVTNTTRFLEGSFVATTRTRSNVPLKNPRAINIIESRLKPQIERVRQHFMPPYDSTVDTSLQPDGVSHEICLFHWLYPPSIDDGEAKDPRLLQRAIVRNTTVRIVDYVYGPGFLIPDDDWYLLPFQFNFTAIERGVGR